MKPTILVIDDEESIRYTFESFLAEEGYNVLAAESVDEAMGIISHTLFDVLFVDILMGGRSGIELLREVKERGMNCPVVMITGYPNIDTASEAVRFGAFDYLPKPVKQDRLLSVARLALQHKMLTDEKERYRAHLEAIFRSVKDAIITVDTERRILALNEAAKTLGTLTGAEIGAMLVLRPASLQAACCDALKETIAQMKPVEVPRIECQRDDGGVQVLEISMVPLKDAHGLLSGAVVVIRDQTHLDGLERNLRERQQFYNIVGKSRKMQEIYSLIDDLADVQTTVLITGESGTGKELVAEALHYRGGRSTKPFVTVNCSALSESLLESELFGHVKGAFTGAVRDKVGRFQRADGGTIFLDEIGDITPRMQLRLLRVLQEKEFERVGDSTPIKVDVRVVAATNRVLREKVKRGEFREDLYYRLKVVEIPLPPLRERREDIPLLVASFLKKFNKKLNKEIVAVSAEVQQMLLMHTWPGNIRELEHTLEHAFILCRGTTITINDLPSDFKSTVESRHALAEEGGTDEPKAILHALEKAAWNKAGAARLLGISRRTIYRKIKEYNLMRDYN
ncbi:MAG: sigma-54-dependent Fis family transcriptional regulator [Nitrospirota bacterium]